MAWKSDYIIEEQGNRYKAKLIKDNEIVTTCDIVVDKDSWTITSWFTEKKFQHQGYGTDLMWLLLHDIKHIYGKPLAMKYIWNGANLYVYDFLVDNFDAECSTPIAVQKYQNEDDWSSHIYMLNIDKFNEFFKL